jgi:hypothetical protein
VRILQISYFIFVMQYSNMNSIYLLLYIDNNDLVIIQINQNNNYRNILIIFLKFLQHQHTIA